MCSELHALGLRLMTLAMPVQPAKAGPTLQGTYHVASGGETIKTALPSAGAPNPYCASFKGGPSNAEDPMSVGVYATFGKFRTIHLGDLTKNKEFKLMCPNNRIGAIDLFLGLHHGQNTSDAEVMIQATHPRVGIMNNGTARVVSPTL
jgi:hypothetical protein